MKSMKRGVATIGATAVLLMTSAGAASAGPDDSFGENLSTCAIEAKKAFGDESHWAYFGFIAGCMAGGGY